MKKWWTLLKRHVPALRSRKTRVAIVTFVVAAAARSGLNLDPDLVFAVVVIGCTVIGGIAIEDAGAKSAGRTTLTGTIENLNHEPLPNMSASEIKLNGGNHS